MAKAPTIKEEALPGAEEQAASLNRLRDFATDGRLARSVRQLNAMGKRPPQGILLEGGMPGDRVSAALYWAALLNCPNLTDEGGPCLACAECTRFAGRMHRDLFFFDGLAGSIKIDEVRAMRSTLGEPLRDGQKRAVIFAEAQAMGEPAANALLKSLEEPQADTVFALTAPQRERLLPTLVSRSWVITLPWPLSLAEAEREDREPAVAEWGKSLLEFAKTGRGWMTKSGRKGDLDARVVMGLVLLCQQELTLALAGRERLSSPLGKAFATLSPSRQNILNEVLAEAQDSLVYTVNPALVADWMATRIFFLFATAS